MENKDLNPIADTTIDSAIGVATVLAGFTNPIMSIAANALLPVLASNLKDFVARKLSSNEDHRLGVTSSIAYRKIKKYIDSGREVRNDDFWICSKTKRSKADIVCEGILLKIRDEYEDKKLIYYSNFLANIGFEESVSYDQANMLLKLSERLSYRQLVILAYLSDDKILEMDSWAVQFKNNLLLEGYYDWYSEIMSLYDYGLLKQSMERKGIELGRCANSQISILGKTLSRLMELKTIPSDDIQEVSTTLEKIKDIIKK